MESKPSNSRTVGIIAVATGIAAIVLLLNHPAEHATDFMGVLKEEAANQMMNAAVHGGYLLVLPVQIVCYAVLTGRIGFNRALAIAGLVFFATGAAIQMADLTIDGLMLPAIAKRYLAAPPDRLPYARTLFVICSTAIQFLMPLGIGFQAAGVAAWGTSMIKQARWTAIAGSLLGLVALTGTIVATVTGMEMFIVAGIACLAVWAFVAGFALMRRTA